jgi:hypothetical protein
MVGAGATAQDFDRQVRDVLAHLDDLPCKCLTYRRGSWMVGRAS